MAKLKDRFYNRVIEGKLELDSSEQSAIDASAVEAVEGASEGSIDKVLGLSSQGKLVKGSVSGGTQLYKHTIGGMATMLVKEIISLSNSPATSFNELSLLVEKAISATNESTIVLKLFNDIPNEVYDTLGISFTGPVGTLGRVNLNLPYSMFDITDTVTPL